MSDSPDVAHWELRVRAAYHRFCGATQAETAQQVGRTERTIRRWESERSWQRAMSEAADLWMTDLEREARARLIRAIREGDAVRAMQVLERIDPTLSPPAQKLEHSGEVKGGDVHVYLPSNGRDDSLPEQLKRRQQAATNGS